MRFPEQRTPCVAPLAASPATPGARPQLALSPDVAKGSEEIEGEWLSLATSATGVCVTPVRVTSTRAGMLGCGREPDHPGGWVYRRDSVALGPVVLVRDIPGAHVGLVDAPYSVVVGPTSNEETVRADRAHVFDANGEVLRIVESHPAVTRAGDDLALMLRYGGRTVRLMSIGAGFDPRWSVYWVGRLNADSIPDLIMRVQRTKGAVQEHAFDLFLSAPDSTAMGTVWQHGVRTWVTTCE
jgi:hypothetical protein